MIKAFALLLALISSNVTARVMTFVWDNAQSNPAGTTTELTVNGQVFSDLTGSSQQVDVSGNIIDAKARAIPPSGYQCGEPLEICPPSSYATLAAYFPDNPVNVWAQKTWLSLSPSFFTDNFDRANESPLAGNWSHSPGGGVLRLSGNAIIGPSVSGDSLSFYNAAIFTDNQFSEYVISSLNGNMDAGPSVRVSSSSMTGYFLATFNGNLQIAKFSNGSFSTIGGFKGNCTIGDIVRLEVSGNVLTAYKNGIQQGTIETDTSIANGNPGLFIYESTASVDNWKGGNL